MSLASGGRSTHRVVEVVAGPRASEQQLQLAEGRHGSLGERPQPAEERRQLGCHGAGGDEEALEVVEPRTQRGERLAPLMQSRRQLGQRLRQRLGVGRDRPLRLPRVAHQVGELRTAVGQRAHRVRGLHQEVLEGPAVPVQLLDEMRGGHHRRCEVVRRAVRLPLLALVPVREPLDHSLEAAARRRVQCVEELVELDDRRRVVRVEHGAVVERRAEVRPRVDVDVAIGDPDQRLGADRGRRPAVKRRELVLDRDLHLGAAVRGQLDPGDAPGRRAADAHDVALDELARVVEDEPVGVRVLAPDEQEQHDRERDEQRDERWRASPNGVLGSRLSHPVSSRGSRATRWPTPEAAYRIRLRFRKRGPSGGVSRNEEHSRLHLPRSFDTVRRSDGGRRRPHQEFEQPKEEI